MDASALQREAYYFDERLGLGFSHAVPDLIALMEMFCVANHGTVIDFSEQDECVKPILKETINPIGYSLPPPKREPGQTSHGKTV